MNKEKVYTIIEVLIYYIASLIIFSFFSLKLPSLLFIKKVKDWHILNAIITKMGFANYLLLTKFVFFPIFLFLIYNIVKEMYTRNEARLSLTLFILSPSCFLLFYYLDPFIFYYLTFLIIFYLILSQRINIFVYILILLLLLLSDNFLLLITTILLLIFLIVSDKKTKIKFKLILIFIILSTLTILLFNKSFNLLPYFPVSAIYHLLSEYSFLYSIPSVYLLLFILGFFESKVKKNFCLFLFISSLIIMYFSLYSKYFVVFATLLILPLASKGIIELIKKKWNSNYLKFLTISFVIILIILSSVSFYKHLYYINLKLNDYYELILIDYNKSNVINDISTNCLLYYLTNANPFFKNQLCEDIYIINPMYYNKTYYYCNDDLPYKNETKEYFYIIKLQDISKAKEIFNNKSIRYLILNKKELNEILKDENSGILLLTKDNTTFKVIHENKNFLVLLYLNNISQS